jgi:hypothetical protein
MAAPSSLEGARVLPLLVRSILGDKGLHLEKVREGRENLLDEV